MVQRTRQEHEAWLLERRRWAMRRSCPTCRRNGHQCPVCAGVY